MTDPTQESAADFARAILAVGWTNVGPTAATHLARLVLAAVQVPPEVKQWAEQTARHYKHDAQVDAALFILALAAPKETRMTDLNDPPPTSGMLPGKPMAQCSECESWSYMAAYDGHCLSCVMESNGDRADTAHADCEETP